jgi:hypothetical protein
MVSRHCFTVLVAIATVLLVGFMVIGGLTLLLVELKDTGMAGVLRTVSFVVLIVLTVDLICIVLALAWNAAAGTERPEDASPGEP